jgi:hypothetical protein
MIVALQSDHQPHIWPADETHPNKHAPSHTEPYWYTQSGFKQLPSLLLPVTPVDALSMSSLLPLFVEPLLLQVNNKVAVRLPSSIRASHHQHTPADMEYSDAPLSSSPLALPPTISANTLLMRGIMMCSALSQINLANIFNIALRVSLVGYYKKTKKKCVLQ